MKKLLSVLISLFSLAVSSQAATITVGPARGGNYDFNRIQSGIDAANNGDIVLVAPKEYEITEPITFQGKAITVRSEAGPEQTIIRMAPNYDFSIVVFENGEDSQSQLEGFTITGSPERGVSCVNSSPRIENCVMMANCESGIQCLSASPIINNCIITGSVGDSGINCRENSSPTITNCTISGNIADGSGGGGIYCNDSSPTIIDCLISENEANAGGGVECINNSSPTMINCEIICNFAEVGSGMHTIDNSQPTLSNCIFGGNSAEVYGGGMYNETNSSPTLSNCTISGNSAQWYGGGISNSENSSSLVINCIIWGNTASNGAQIYNEQGSSTTVSYSNLQHSGRSSWPGESNINKNPLFADENNGDYHLKSNAGRWDSNSQSWVIDDVNSPCIDTGDPNRPVASEPYPNGININMGAYGGTTEASKSPSGLHAKYGGGKGEFNNPYQIYTAEHLNTLCNEPNDYDKHFELMVDVNMAQFTYDRAVIAPDTNDIEDGFQGPSFAGVFDGNNHTVSHLTIKGKSFIALFGQLAYGAMITKFGLEAVDVNGTGDYIGGLVGYNNGNIWESHTTGEIRGSSNVGGLVGENYGYIIACNSNSMVKGTGNNIGGLIGYFSQGIAVECYCKCNVSGLDYIGGLIGFNDVNSVISMNYSHGSVTGNFYIGGLVACNYGSIENSYSYSSVTAYSYLGGLVGENYGSINNCYSRGLITGNDDDGGLVGFNNGGSITNSFWDMETSGQSTSDGGTGKTTTETQTKSTFTDAGWDFIYETINGDEDVWWINEGDYPHLWWEPRIEPYQLVVSGYIDITAVDQELGGKLETRN